MERIETGIPGLDNLTEGGLPVGGVYIVQGAPGTGKTILGNQMCFHRARSGQQAIYITLLAETHARVFASLERMRFFEPAMIGRSVNYHAAYDVLKQGLDGLITLIRTAAVERSASFIVVDGFMAAGQLASSKPQLKELLHGIQTVSSSLGCTVLLLSSDNCEDGAPPEHTIVDGIIDLSLELRGVRARRLLEIRKLRGTNPVLGRHSVEIDERGLTVTPRLEARIAAGRSERRAAPLAGRVPFDLPVLDRMLGGGLPRGSITMLVGPTGTGKTILGLQFVSAGARSGERSLYLGFYERPDAILAKSRRIGLGIHDAVEAGAVELMWERPVEGVLDLLADRLLSRIRTLGATRVCIDGLHSLRRTIDVRERIGPGASSLCDELERLGVTAVHTIETPDLFGSSVTIPIDDISASTHNLILLRHVERGAQLHQLISILKMRDSGYDPRIRELRITDAGIVIAEKW